MKSTDPTRTWRLAVAAGCAALGLALGACTSAPGSGPRAAADPVVGAAVAPNPAATGAAPNAPYVALADAVHAHAADVWLEADFVKAWRAGPDRYQQVLEIISTFAARPGVRGVKIADELGYGDGVSPSQALGIVKQSTAALHARVPGTKVLVDFVVPELGCLAWQHAGGTAPTPDSSAPGTGVGGIPASMSAALASERACAATARGKDPGASLASVDSVIVNGGLDVVDLSAGLLDESQYEAWGTTRDAAMTAIWEEASRRWGSAVTLQARKALAHPGSYRGDAQTAEADVHTFVDIPLAHGASAVDVWTWSQPYQGGTYQLTDPGLADNALIEALRARRAKGDHLWTHMTPSALQRGIDADVTAATAIFGSILVASGTG